jgi:hypothetical protein
MTDDPGNFSKAISEAVAACDDYLRALDALASALAKMSPASLSDDDERDHHQRMIYAFFLAPARSSN